MFMLSLNSKQKYRHVFPIDTSVGDINIIGGNMDDSVKDERISQRFVGCSFLVNINIFFLLIFLFLLFIFRILGTNTYHNPQSSART